jgi:Tol biopolymer transport system component
MRSAVRVGRRGWAVVLAGVAACQSPPTEPGGALPVEEPLAADLPPPQPVPRIVFSEGYGGGDSQIWSIRRDGTGLTKVTDGPYSDGTRYSSGMHGPAWALAGSARIAFEMLYETLDYFHHRLMTINLNGTDLQFLGPTDVHATGISWSSDGARLAFSGGDTTNVSKRQISVIGADGSGLVSLASDPTFISGPAWSPDGQRIVYFTATDLVRTAFVNERGIWSEKADGTERTKLLTIPAGDDGFNRFQFSPDGTKLAMCHFAHYLESNLGTLEVMNANGTGRISLGLGCDASGHRWGPQWSPDGSRILTASEGRIWTIAPDGSSLVQLTFEGQSHGAKWSRQGTRIAYLRDSGLWVMWWNGSSQIRLTGDSLHVDDFSWGP